MTLLKKCSIALAAVLMAGCISCGDSGDDDGVSSSSKSRKNSGSSESSTKSTRASKQENSSERSSQARVAGSDDVEDNRVENDCAPDDISGKYVTIIPYYGRTAEYKEKLDNGIEYAFDTADESGIISLKFDDESFEMLGDRPNTEIAKYSGSYEVDDGMIVFSYEKYHCEDTDVDLSEEPPEYDKDIIINGRKAKAVKDLTDDEQIAIIKEERRKQGICSRYEELQKYNESGTYYNIVGPSIAKSDKVIAYNILPYFAFNIAGTRMLEGSAFMLYPVDDFICVPTYGFRLDGDYDKGGDFTITYNMLDAYLDDPYSTWNLYDYDNDSSGTAEKRRELIKQQFGNLDDTTIEFSDGKWVWKNSEGELLNNGTYLESDDHEGFVGMLIDDDSKKNDKMYQQFSPLFFYIDSDGKIWYPNWIKMD